MEINTFFKSKIFKRFLYYIRFYELSFYFLAFKWHLKHKTPEKINPKEVYKIFYLDFLKVPPEDCIIVEMTEDKLVTHCKNRCPILDFSLFCNIDTKQSCKRISEGPCKYFLRKINKDIVFKRNYRHIRPYEEDCEETIIINHD